MASTTTELEKIAGDRQEPLSSSYSQPLALSKVGKRWCAGQILRFVVGFIVTSHSAFTIVNIDARYLSVTMDIDALR